MFQTKIEQFLSVFLLCEWIKQTRENQTCILFWPRPDAWRTICRQTWSFVEVGQGKSVLILTDNLINSESNAKFWKLTCKFLIWELFYRIRHKILFLQPYNQLFIEWIKLRLYLFINLFSISLGFPLQMAVSKLLQTPNFKHELQKSPFAEYHQTGQSIERQRLYRAEGGR